jgi:hypothetical protein
MLQMSIDPYDGSLSGLGQITATVSIPAKIRDAARQSGLSDALPARVRAVIQAAAAANATHGMAAYRRLSSSGTMSGTLTAINSKLEVLVSTMRRTAATQVTVSELIAGGMVPGVMASLSQVETLLKDWNTRARAAIRAAGSSNAATPPPNLPPNLPGPEVPPMVTDTEEGMSTGAKFGLALLAVAVGYGVYKATEEEEGSPAMAGLRGAVYKGTPRKLVYTTKKRCLRWGRGPSGARRCRKYSKAARR